MLYYTYLARGIILNFSQYALNDFVWRSIKLLENKVIFIIYLDFASFTKKYIFLHLQKCCYHFNKKKNFHIIFENRLLSLYNSYLFKAYWWKISLKKTYYIALYILVCYFTSKDNFLQKKYYIQYNFEISFVFLPPSFIFLIQDFCLCTNA